MLTSEKNAYASLVKTYKIPMVVRIVSNAHAPKTISISFSLLFLLSISVNEKRSGVFSGSQNLIFNQFAYQCHLLAGVCSKMNFSNLSNSP